jgi:hypothetical protein
VLCAICRWRKNTDDARRGAKNAQDALNDSDDSDSVPPSVRSALADLSDDDDVFAPGAGNAQAAASSSSSLLSRPGTSESLPEEESDMCDDNDFEPVPTGGNKRKRLVQADSDSE